MESGEAGGKKVEERSDGDERGMTEMRDRGDGAGVGGVGEESRHRDSENRYVAEHENSICMTGTKETEKDKVKTQDPQSNVQQKHGEEGEWGEG